MLMIQDIYAYGPQHVVLVITDTCATMHIVTLLAVESLQHDGSDGRFWARGGRRRKLLLLFGRALRVCRPRLRHSAASATSRGSKSTTDRLAASGLRRSRGHAQPAEAEREEEQQQEAQAQQAPQQAPQQAHQQELLAASVAAEGG